MTRAGPGSVRSRPAVSGAIPVKLIGKIGGPDRDSRIGIDADLTR